MTMEQVGAPVALAVSMDAAREALRRDDDALDLTIRIALTAIAAEAEQITRLKLVNRPMRVTLDSFPRAIRLASPTWSVESVRFLDAGGEQQTLDQADYYVDKVSRPGYIMPAHGKAWPATYGRANSVVVDFTAGHGPTDEAVPDEAKDYILGCLQLRFDPTSKVTKDDLASLLDGKKVFG
ncbi:MAG: hypothetical protein M3Y65_20550 [Pseudomonadota bacterium]|nr:hypothetical protein [Pseudomonadota bacterium]